MTNYRVKISTRAKHVSLRITPTDGLVVVVPKGFNHALLDNLVARRSGWIERTLRRYAEISTQIRKATLPEKIHLTALGEQWVVSYIPSAAKTVRVMEKDNFQLRIVGDIENKQACYQALRRWLMRHAKKNIAPLFELASSDCGLPYNKLTIRGQRTRWGSCSRQASINLNFQLLFVSPAMMNYVFVHELCHTVHLNHSSEFYALLASFIPDYRAIESALKQAWQSMPNWLLKLA